METGNKNRGSHWIFSFWVKANTLRKFHENLWLGVSNDSRRLQIIGINVFLVVKPMSTLTTRQGMLEQDV